VAAAVAGLLAVGLGACGSDEPERDETTNEITETGDADVFSIEVGDCMTDESSTTGQVEEVPVTPCDQPHASEVYLSYMIETADLPDPTAMEAIVQDQCLGGFESFVGMAYEQSVLEVTWLEPTQGSWDGGDRELLCMVYDPSGDVTGSLQGAAR
jgi:hypothetical protein